MNRFILFFKSKAFKNGYKSGATEIGNPYAAAARDENIRKGTGASPYWSTGHKQFNQWCLGASIKRGERLDKMLAALKK